MKIALCTSDFFATVQQSVRQTEHEISEVWCSASLDTNFATGTKRFADEIEAEFRVGRLSESDVRALALDGVELLISAGYDFKIPTPSDCNIRFINVHGSLLPHGRGPWPQPWILLEYPHIAGVTIHSMSQRWDYGDVLLQRPIELSESDNLQSLVAKTCILAGQLTSELLADFDNLWLTREPMAKEGSYWKIPSEDLKTILFENDVAQIRRLVRAFGEFTLFLDPDTRELRRVGKFSSWEAPHQYEPGTLVARSLSNLIIAARNGFVCIDPIV